MQLDNFIATEERYPVIATTSKLMTTGVDAKMCKVIVLDTVINSMTEFKQIIGRGTRLNFDAGKTHFTIIDFRNATRLFRDDEFDGEPVQVEDYDGSQGTPDEWVAPDGNGEDDGTMDNGELVIREKYYVDNVSVEILAERVQYYDENGNQVTKSFTDFGRSELLKQYRSLDGFLERWNSAERKQEVMIELFKNKVLLEKLEAEVGQEYDPFDLICHIAYDKPALTRSERVKKVKQDDVYTQYGDLARRVLDGLLVKYTADGVAVFEQAADRKQAQQLLKLDPFNKMGSPQQIARAFGGIKQYLTAINSIKSTIYEIQ